MRVALVAVVLATACNSPQPQPDGHYVSPCAPKPAGGMLCEDTCGNGVVEDCLTYGLYGEECLVYSWKREVCDGDSRPCTDLGYFGGTAACSSCREYSTAACEVCPPDAELCAPLDYISFATGLAPNTLATSGTGVIDVYDLQGSAPVQIAELAVPTNNARALTAVPGGWIVVSSGLEANFVSDSGVVGPTTTIASTPIAYIVQTIYAANRVFVVWSDAQAGVQAAVLDASGALVAGPTQIQANTSAAAENFSAATDGTAVFVAVQNRLTKVLANGTVATPTTFAVDPSDDSVVTCASTTCWFLADSAALTTEFTAQRFDANATPIGAPITLPRGFSSFLADGTDLLALSSGALPLRLVRFDAMGTMLGTKIVAAANGGDLFHLGARIVVLFNGHVAVVTPP